MRSELGRDARGPSRESKHPYVEDNISTRARDQTEALGVTHMKSAAAHRGSISPEIEAAIRRRAQEIYQQHGSVPGHELEDWLQAEAEVMQEFAARQVRSAARIVVRVHGVTYVGEYDPNDCGGYHPGEFSHGQQLYVRFDQDRMYVTRPNGSELEAKVVERV